jgi:DNA-binding response OmpR family regulator
MGNILVLEDDEELSKLLDMVLTEEGYGVQCARTVGQALEIVQVCQPDVVLFDMLLADQDGGAFVRAYRELPGSTAPLIAVSGLANLEREAARIGADGHLGKPFDVDDLLALVEGHLGRP